MATSAPKPAAKSAPKLVSKGSATAEQGEGEPIVKKKSKKKAIIIAAAITVMLGAAGGAAFVFMGPSGTPAANPDAPPSEEAKNAEPEKPPLFVVVDPFTVNLQHEGAGDQFLQVSFSLQLADQKQEELFKLYQPQARSRLLLLLSSKRASEISTVEGKKKLADDIVAQLKIPFSAQSAPLDVRNVFFTSFVIQ
jgi:flagellar FliL protein